MGLTLDTLTLELLCVLLSLEVGLLCHVGVLDVLLDSSLEIVV
jgi:hypothetical protein